MGTRSRDHVFVVRTWLESPDDGRTMRGRIDHLASGSRRYFANFGDLCDFIAGSLASQPAGESIAATEDTNDPADG